MWVAHGVTRMTIPAQIAALANKSVAELTADYIAAFGKKPRRRHPDFLRKRLVFQLQVAAYGGLPGPARAELERLASELRLPDAAPQDRVRTDDRDGQAGRPRPGTLLQRSWHGQQIRVEVLPDAFTWNGHRYGSLSAVANAVTGQHLNGRVFFGLTKRSSK
jgi:hypothetical protein